MRSSINTCLDCKDRVLGCHSTCERYIAAKKKHDEEQAKLRSLRNSYYMRPEKPRKKIVDRLG